MFKRPRLLRAMFVSLACVACTGGTFTCSSGDHDDDGHDKVIVKGTNK